MREQTAIPARSKSEPVLQLSRHLLLLLPLLLASNPVQPVVADLNLLSFIRIVACSAAHQWEVSSRGLQPGGHSDNECTAAAKPKSSSSDHDAATATRSQPHAPS